MVRKRLTRRDPTRTGLIRRRFERDVRVRFARLRHEIVRYVSEGAAGGPGLTTNARWTFSSASDGVKRFQKWINDRADQLVLEESGIKTPSGHWTDVHITTAYFKGAEQATQAHPSGKGQASWVMSSLRSPVNIEKVELIKERAFEKLKAITLDMSNKIGDNLADGIVRGDSPRQVARDMAKTIEGIQKKRALTLARTETIRAHAEGSLNAMEQLGVKTVGVDVEWQATMIDENKGLFEEKVCPLCQELAGMVIPIAKAHGLLPRHPNCRCAWVPSVLGADPTNQRKARIRASIRAGLSKKAKQSKSAVKDAIAKESWSGLDQL